MGFWSFLEKKEAKALGIDIGSSAIKVVELKRQNSQAVLATYGELSLGPYASFNVGQAVSLPPEKVAEALRDLLNEKEVNVSTKLCGLSIPFGSSLMSVIEMPEVGEKELARMVPLEARKYIPVPISEVQLDWSVIPKSEARPAAETVDDATETSFNHRIASSMPKVDVLVVAIHNETIARFQQIVSQAEIEASFFEIEIFATCRAVLEETLLPVMIMDIGAASTKLYIVERGIIRTSHTVNRGSQDITAAISQSLSISPKDAEVLKRKSGAASTDENLTRVITIVLDYIFAESNNTLLVFEKKYNKTISKVILVGGGSALKGLTPLAKDAFKTEVVAANPFSKVSVPAFLAQILAETGPEFAVAVGLALRKLSETEE